MKPYNRKIHQLYKVHPSLLISGQLGLEIECEGKDLFKNPLQYWVCHNDHSLRNYQGHSPVEYVLGKPLSREEIEDALKYLTGKLKLKKSLVIDSPRTSVHVHINVQQDTFKEVLTFVCAYLLLEDLLVAYSGPDRVGNLYCLRARDAENYVYLIEEGIRNNDYQCMTKEDLRYGSVNLSSLSKFGSLEFRSLKGTVDQDKILSWVDILLELKTSSQKFRNPQDLVSHMEKILLTESGNKVVKALLPTQHGEVLNHSYGLKEAIWAAVRRVKDIAWSTSEWIEEREVDKKPRKVLLKKSLSNEVNWTSSDPFVFQPMVDTPSPQFLYANTQYVTPQWEQEDE